MSTPPSNPIITPIPPKRSPNSYPSTSTNFTIIKIDSDTKSSENPSTLHLYHRTWDCETKELCRVTEYNESLECSLTEEDLEFPQITKLGSIIEKFPKFSVASLCFSDTSNPPDNRKHSIDCRETPEPGPGCFQDRKLLFSLDSQSEYCGCSCTSF